MSDGPGSVSNMPTFLIILTRGRGHEEVERIDFSALTSHEAIAHAFALVRRPSSVADGFRIFAPDNVFRVSARVRFDDA